MLSKHIRSRIGQSARYLSPLTLGVFDSPHSSSVVTKPPQVKISHLLFVLALCLLKNNNFRATLCTNRV